MPNPQSMIHAVLGDGRSGRLTRLTLLALLVAVAIILAVRFVLVILSPTSVWDTVSINAVAPSQPAQIRTYDFSYDPFLGGGEDIIVTPVIDTGSDAPETTLNLTLKGMRAGDNGSAFLRTPDGNEDNFYIDDEILSGVFLRGVFPDYVLLDVNGQRQRLTTDDAKAARRQSGNPNGQTPTSTLSTIRPPDATDLLSKVQIIPNFSSKMKRNGVVLKPRSAGVKLSDFGLQDGDVLTSIAGVSLAEGVPNISDIRRRIRPGTPVRVTIIRDEQPLTLTLGSPS